MPLLIPKLFVILKLLKVFVIARPNSGSIHYVALHNYCGMNCYGELDSDVVSYSSCGHLLSMYSLFCQCSHCNVRKTTNCLQLLFQTVNQ